MNATRTLHDAAQSCWLYSRSSAWIFEGQPPQHAGTRRLTLADAVHLALTQNHTFKIARLKVIENEQKKAGQRSALLPTIKNESNIVHATALQSIAIPAGAFGSASAVERLASGLVRAALLAQMATSFDPTKPAVPGFSLLEAEWPMAQQDFEITEEMNK